MKFLVKLSGRDVVLDEAQLESLVGVVQHAEAFLTQKYVGHNKGTYGGNMEYTDVIEQKPVHEWLEIRPMDPDLYSTLKLVAKLEK